MAGNATVHLDVRRHAGPIDPRVFGGFLEHIGRAVYEGVYDPDSPRSDEHGFRKDVIEALQPLKMPVMRYPGGNFVSNYDWRDGIGPKDQRRARPDFAWKTIEPNRFGVDEFMAWCKVMGTDPLMVVNLGTGTEKDAAELLEYCNLPGGMYWADRRIENGQKEPYGIKLWGLGNEMDGPWQSGHVHAGEYAERAWRAAQLMKGLDPSIELVLCGSSGPMMPTYLEWDRIALEKCWEQVEYIAAHRYVGNGKNNTPEFLAVGVEIDQQLSELDAVIQYVKGRKKSEKNVYVAFDEWNVWYRTMPPKIEWWEIAPHQVEEVYNLEDALVVAQFFNSFIRRSDVVKIACIAQIVNVIAPIMTRTDDLLVQSIYYPFVMYAANAKGLALTPLVEGPTYDAGEDKRDVPVVDASASFDSGTSKAAVFLVNRDMKNGTEVKVSLNGLTIEKVESVQMLSGDDPKAENSWENQDIVKPGAGEAELMDGSTVRVQLPALGLAVVILKLTNS